MTVFNVISLIGGLALFLFGMNQMSGGLEKVAGGKMQKVLKKLTSNKFKGLLLGVGVTAVIQSSGALTVMLVGLVNSGIMELEQAAPVIMGSNIGTTVTAWILSLTGISSDSIGLQLLKPEYFSPIIGIIAVIMLGNKKQKRRDAGAIMMGFAVLMMGMTMMSKAMAPLADMPQFTQFITIMNNPFLGVLFGIIFTALLQSSSASVGVIQALSITGVISYGMVIPIIMGQNIGTCIAAVLGAIGTNKNAKRVAAFHVSFNVIATAVFLTLWLVLDSIFHFKIKDQPVNPAMIAILHSIFNIAATALLFPFTKQLVKLVRRIVKDGTKDAALLDDNLLTIPAFAVAKAYEVTSSMAKISRDAVKEAIGMFQVDAYTENSREEIKALESETDAMEDELSSYLVRISNQPQLAEKDVKATATMLHAVSDWERLADHAVNLAICAKDKADKDIHFYSAMHEELDVLYEAVLDIVDRSARAFADKDVELAQTVEPLEEVIDELIMEVKSRMVTRLQAGHTTVENGFVINDLLTNLERISDHCSNVAVAVIEGKQGAFDQHVYLEKVKNEPSSEFKKMYSGFLEEYSIPAEKDAD